MTASTQGVWAPGPASPLLAEADVHVWRADLETVAEEVCLALCEREHARAERFLRERDGRLWRRSRGVLRALLGSYLGLDPSSLRFVTGTYGKPELIDDSDERLSFNLSHSGHTALYALARSGPVGVDVERPRRSFDAVAIAARELGGDEAQRLRALPPSERQREFLRAWVRHEAQLKCLGLGLGAAQGPQDGSALWTSELQIGADGVAAVATPERPTELRCWQWPARLDG
jgi:4'-phosphopantetheinyl transferase